MRLVTPQVARLQAELCAMDLWDRLLAETDDPSQIERDAGKARFLRRVQVIAELCRVSEKKRLFRQCRVTAVIARRA